MPAPYETPAMPTFRASAGVFARAQSITLEASAMSGGPADFYLAAGLPEAADVVTDHDIAGVGELLGLGEVLDLGQAPARGQHDERVARGCRRRSRA